MSDIVEGYRYYRSATNILIEKINDSCLDIELIKRIARIMGLEDSYGRFVDELGLNIAAASASIDYKVKGKTIVEKYYEEPGAENEEEELLLKSFMASYNSLFRVEEVDEPNSSMLLYDLMNKKELVLTDIGTTKSIVEQSLDGLLLFCKVIQIKDLHITAGYALPFHGGFEKLYASKYYGIVKKIKTKNPVIKRIAAFYQLHQKYGINSKLDYLT